MKKLNFIKISLDIIMAIVFALLFNKMVFGGLVFHEIAGTAIGAAFIIHMGLNWRWIKQISLKIFSSSISIKTRIGYVVDMLLLITMVITIISGIATSKVIFSNFSFGNIMNFRAVHKSVPYIALMLLGIHIGLHWVWVMSVFKKIFKITAIRKSLTYIAKVIVVVVLTFGIYNIYNTNYFSRISMVTGIFSESQMPGGDRKEAISGNTSNKQISSRPEGMGEHAAGGMAPSVNPLRVVSSYLGITAVFIIATYYMEKLLMVKKSKGNIIILK